ncbi:hypothetical protein [Microbulbifer sp. MCCC 1A16149]|uniref:hypothetical protein n=1 Tax=Microbulbifer sp. MCCC 1A16149 TaxID=3411322 RepID=UPI003D0AEC56
MTKTTTPQNDNNLTSDTVVLPQKKQKLGQRSFKHEKRLACQDWWYNNNNAISILPLTYKGNDSLVIPGVIKGRSKKWLETYESLILNLHHVYRVHSDSRCLSILIQKGEQFLVGGRKIIENIVFQLEMSGLIEVKKGCKGYSTKIRFTSSGYKSFSFISVDCVDIDNSQMVFYKDPKGRRIAASEEVAKTVGGDTLRQYQNGLYDSDIRVDGNPISDADKTLFRLFHTKEMIYDGRLQGACWMSMQSSLRDTITINGSPTCEVDIRSTQSTIFYGLVGADLPEDIYSCEILPKGRGDNSYINEINRSLCKRIMLLLLSIEAPIYGGAVDVDALISKIKQSFLDKDRIKEEEMVSLKEWRRHLEKDYKITLDEIILSMMESHKVISKYFGRGSWKNANLHESNILLRVIEYFSSKSEPVLTVHDSFIIGEQYKQELIEVATQAINDELGSSFTSDQVLKVQ